MLLFHGTTEDALSGILEHGLQPPRPHDHHHDWAWDLSGRSQSSAVFLSTSPVAGKGGDPVSFALDWPGRRYKTRQPGYIVVIDLPADALHLVHAVVPNLELDHFIAVSAARRRLAEPKRVEAGTMEDGTWRMRARWTISHWCLHYWLARYCADHQIPLVAAALESLLRTEIAPSRVGAEMTPARWQAFLQDYFRFIANTYFAIKSDSERERKRKAVMRKHGVALPPEDDEDEHTRTCFLCMRGRFTWSYHFDGFNEYAPFKAFLRDLPTRRCTSRNPETLPLHPYAVTYSPGTLGDLAMTLRAVVAHTAPFAGRELLRFFQAHESRPNTTWTWDAWYAQFPASACALPPAWVPGYCRRFTPDDLKVHDRQVIAAPIPARYVLGAIRVTNGTRFVTRVRPSRQRGETLLANLWTLTHRLRAAYAGTPLVIE